MLFRKTTDSPKVEDSAWFSHGQDRFSAADFADYYNAYLRPEEPNEKPSFFSNFIMVVLGLLLSLGRRR